MNYIHMGVGGLFIDHRNEGIQEDRLSRVVVADVAAAGVNSSSTAAPRPRNGFAIRPKFKAIPFCDLADLACSKRSRTVWSC